MCSYFKPGGGGCHNFNEIYITQGCLHTTFSFSNQMIFEQNFRKKVTIFQNFILSQRTNINIIEFPCVKIEKLVFVRNLKM